MLKYLHDMLAWVLIFDVEAYEKFIIDKFAEFVKFRIKIFAGEVLADFQKYLWKFFRKTEYS